MYPFVPMKGPNYKKDQGFLMFSEGKERVHLEKMG